MPTRRPTESRDGLFTGGRWRDLRDLGLILTGIGVIWYEAVFSSEEISVRVLFVTAGLALLGVPAYLINGRGKP